MSSIMVHKIVKNEFLKLGIEHEMKNKGSYLKINWRFNLATVTATKFHKLQHMEKQFPRKYS
jgi:hypothetical protein